MADYITYISEITTYYDAFILDLWGVIHDGQQLYPGVRECLQGLRAQDKKIVFLSNAPRRAAAAQEALERMGITRDLYDAIITSGETAYQCLAKAHDAYFTPAGNRYVYIGLEKDRRILAGLAYEETADPGAAHFVLLSHSYYDHQPQAELTPLLQACRGQNLPVLCINPDLEVVRIGGERVYCAGVIAQTYRDMGGEVVYFGKPHKAVYDACLGVMTGVELCRIVAVGDSLKTDIRGANGFGIACALVTGGVLKDAMGAPGSAGYKHKLEELCAAEAVTPDYILPAFNG